MDQSLWFSYLKGSWNECHEICAVVYSEEEIKRINDSRKQQCYDGS